MIGKVLEYLSLGTRTATQHFVRTDAIGEQFRCVKRNKRHRTT